MVQWIGLLLLIAPLSALCDTEKRGVILNWLPVEEAAKYEVELSDTPQFQSIKEKRTLKTTRLQVELYPGTYHYRVRGIHHLGEAGPWSDSRPLAVNPFPPKLLLPANLAEIYSSPSKRAVQLSWKAGLTGSAYRLEVYQGNDRIFYKDLNQPAFDWQQVEEGEYRWRVGYRDSVLPQWSDWFSFKVIAHRFMPASTLLSCKYGASEKLEVVLDRQPPQGSDGIPDLEWSQEGCEVQVAEARTPGVMPRFFLTILGRHQSKSAVSLYSDPVLIQKSADGSFRYKTEIKGPSTQLGFSSPQLNGQRPREIILARLSAWSDLVDEWKPKPKPKPEKRSGFSLNLSYTSLSYDQTNVSHFTQTSLTGRFGAYYRLSSQWDLAGSFYLTALPIKTNQTGIDARSLGVNGRLGYRLPFIREPWRITLMGGAYYTSTTATNDAFGYNLIGPQLYPSIRRAIGSSNAISLYFKASPLDGISFANRELAAGGAWSFIQSSGRAINIVIDVSTLKGEISSPPKAIKLTTYSLGLGYEF